MDVAGLKSKAENQYVAFSKLMVGEVVHKIIGRMVVIPQPEDDWMFGQLLEIAQNNISDDEDAISLQKMMTTNLYAIKQKDRPSFNVLKAKVELYFSLCSAQKITDEALGLCQQNKTVGFNFLVYPFYVLGTILNELPIWFIRYITVKLVKEQQFLSSVRMVVSLFTYLFYFPLLVLLLGFFIGNYWFTALCCLFCMIVFRFKFHQFSLHHQQKKLKRLKENQGTKYQQLTQLRKEISSIFHFGQAQ